MLGKLFEARKNTKGGSTEFRGNQHTSRSKPEKQDLSKPNATSRQIAKEQGVSHSTVEEAGNYAKGLDEAEKVSPGIREKVLSGEVKVPKSTIAEIRKMPEEEKAEAVNTKIPKIGKLADTESVSAKNQTVKNRLIISKDRKGPMKNESTETLESFD